MNAHDGYLKSALVVCLIVSLFAAITDFAEGRWLSAAWIAYAGALSLSGAWKRTRPFIVASLPVWAGALLRLYVLEGRPAGFTVLANARFSLFIMAAFFLVATYLVQRRSPMHSTMKGFAYAAAFTIILATLKENSDFISDPHYRNLGYSYVLAFYAASFLTAGFMRGSRTLRLCGIALALTVLAKLYLYDIWTMSTLVRIIAGFSLGLALVLLSVFYQKFRERLFPKSGAAALVLCLLLPWYGVASAFEAHDAYAAEFRSSGWKYYKEIRGYDPAIRQPGSPFAYGKFRLDEDMARYGSSSDIRISWGGIPLPWFSRGMQANPKLRGSLKPALIFGESDRDGGTYVLKLPEPPAGTEFTVIDISAEGNYEAGVRISTGREAGRWEDSEHRSIFNYSTDKYTSVRFRSGDHRYIRLRFDNRLKFSFPAAHFAPVSTRSEYELDIPPSALMRDSDSDRKASIYYYDNEGKRRIVRLVLRFSDERFTRLMEVYSIGPASRGYGYLMSAGLARRSGDPDTQVIDFHRPVQGAIKLVILDRDNTPLKLVSVKAYIPLEELIFELPRTEDAAVSPSASLRVYYGNPYAESPRFDISETFDEALGIAAMQPGMHTKNADFGYSIVEPPVSTWIIRLLFIAGLLGLAFPVWRIFTDYAAAGYGRREEPEK